MRGWIAIFVLCTLCGCQALHVNDILTEAERQLSDAPDSALVTLQSVKRHALLRPNVRARYGLIYSAALDKNFVDVASDSLIRYSASYYDVHGTAEERMRSYYYLGRTSENAKNYQQALLYYLDAAQYTESVEDNYLKGLLYSRLGQMYEKYYNYDVAKKYFVKSYDFYVKAKLERHQAYLLYRIAIRCEEERRDKGIELLHKVIADAKASGYNEILPSCYEELLNKYVEKCEYDKASEILHLLDSTAYQQIRTIGSIAEILEYKNHSTEAWNIAKSGWKFAANKLDSSKMYCNISRIYFLKEQYNKSRDYYNQALLLQLQIALQNNAESISKAEQEYFTGKIIEKKKKNDRRNITIIAIFVCIALFSIYITIYIHIKKKREIAQKNHQISQYHLAVQSLQRDIRKITVDSFGDKFGTINRLCSTYYEYANIPNQQLAIFRKVSDLIESMRNDKKSFEDMEDRINRCYDNILINLKAELPKLNNQEYVLFCYLCAGFSNQAISVFMQCECGAIATRKSRLKSKITISNPPSCAQFLEQFK